MFNPDPHRLKYMSRFSVMILGKWNSPVGLQSKFKFILEALMVENKMIRNFLGFPWAQTGFTYLRGHCFNTLTSSPTCESPKPGSERSMSPSLSNRSYSPGLPFLDQQAAWLAADGSGLCWASLNTERARKYIRTHSVTSPQN